ncbi:SubName: Full=Uncharacterized protein {ECO:0000313/EMBL:CCA70384.1} [Serendipita indica DSM 11827]|uniref:Uncharacterized protein n=1 Tax=Serendipita indica (strain DSM 11827) TaxID=1109443 RepID=G4TGE1_SERID|nr:SubName: Full=Uncharacterized protein {ECO:0000313/EMBL:CCA70384.1} [Serendipita indica DSM 11827]CCA70384.1 hypothetical protein PIIN_04323 [Serendipita indica DSM 11827]
MPPTNACDDASPHSTDDQQLSPSVSDSIRIESMSRIDHGQPTLAGAFGTPPTPRKPVASLTSSILKTPQSSSLFKFSVPGRPRSVQVGEIPPATRPSNHTLLRSAPPKQNESRGYFYGLGFLMSPSGISPASRIGMADTLNRRPVLLSGDEKSDSHGEIEEHKMRNAEGDISAAQDGDENQFTLGTPIYTLGLAVQTPKRSRKSEGNATRSSPSYSAAKVPTRKRKRYTTSGLETPTPRSKYARIDPDRLVASPLEISLLGRTQPSNSNRKFM